MIRTTSDSALADSIAAKRLLPSTRTATSGVWRCTRTTTSAAWLSAFSATTALLLSVWITAPAFLLLSTSAPTPALAQSAPIEDLSAFPHATLEITASDKKQPPRKHHFDIWIANTDTRQEQGLMFVRDLPASQGMIFPMSPPRVATFWMKNTYIELDMIFIGTNGQIIKIIDRAQPLKLDSLSSDRPVAAVLEIKGGEAARLGLRVGDVVSWSPPAGSAAVAP